MKIRAVPRNIYRKRFAIGSNKVQRTETFGFCFCSNLRYLREHFFSADRADFRRIRCRFNILHLME